MATERFIENNVIRNQSPLGFTNAPVIRRCRAGRGYGVVDLLFLPASGPHDVVLVEAKSASSPDASARVVGQLLLYYVGLSRFGSEGVNLLRQFAASNPKKARSITPKLLKSLSGGITPPAAAWAAMQAGERVQKNRIALWIALDAKPSSGLKEVLCMLADDHSVEIGVASVIGRNCIEVWSPNDPSPVTPARQPDWKTQLLPSKHARISLSRNFSRKEIDRMRAGVVPAQMEDKWFIYWQENFLFFHRSWTGVCIYVVRFVQNGDGLRMYEADVNREPSEYTETSDAKDAALISYLIDTLLLHQDAEFPCDSREPTESAIAAWSLVGKAMLGHHPRHEGEAEPTDTADSR